MNTYDLLVIGSGPAGQRAAISDVKKGTRVALAEAVGQLPRQLRRLIPTASKKALTANL